MGLITKDDLHQIINAFCFVMSDKQFQVTVNRTMECLPLCQSDRSEISGNTRGKWNDIFRLNRANQYEWLIPLFIAFPYFPIRVKNRFVKNGTANSSRNIPTEISGPPPEVIPNIAVRKKPKGPFNLNSDRNFRNLCHNEKRP